MQYAELRCKTNFSFLTGASHPEEYVERAAELGLTAIAVTDRDGVYGIPRAYGVLKQRAGPSPKLITGAELTLEDRDSLTLLARDRRGYGLLCRILTSAHEGKPKGEACLKLSQLVSLMSLPGRESLIALPSGPLDPQTYPHVDYSGIRELFDGRFYIPLGRFLDGWDGKRTERALVLAKTLGVPLVATCDAHYHLASRRRCQDLVSAIRHGVTLKAAGMRLFSNTERRLKSPAEMAFLFRDLPEALRATIEIAESCTFSPSELRYRYPSEWIPAGHTAQSYLAERVRIGAGTRYPDGVPSDVCSQLTHELRLINGLQFADYFLTIWEIVEFAREKGILCQGRGAAANSVVCYCLGITAVDPVRMNLLFERFISVERGEPPDIDVDFEHERREEVIQHLYEKYGRDRAAMVSAVITYRSRSAIRETAKALGVELDEAKAGQTPGARMAQTMAEELEGFPRHLSIHSGGFTLSADPIIETVPVEPARMQGRTIIQWDKYDLDTIGLLKVDVLALGMLSAIRKCCDNVGLTLATIPAEDKPTYAMIQKADTVGTFQIESRAQMNMLGRLRPETFYDLVIQVAIVRPGPIMGKMVHPYLRRRRGQEPVDVPHPKLVPILERTLGVPLFQEQVMKIAVALAGFTPGEADELRRAIGAWRSSGSIEKMGEKLRDGLLASGLPREYVVRIFAQIKGFAEYGFPESHAASFALLAYASSYLKCHHPAEFACALLNSQPMGFYASHSLVDDAKRHGVTVHSVHPNFSDWDSVARRGEVQLGLRVVSGLAKADALTMLIERERRPFTGIADLLARVRLRPGVLHRLALSDAFACFGATPRDALWEILAHDALARPEASGQLSLFAGASTERGAVALKTLDALEEVQADYASYRLSTRDHPMRVLRSKLPGLPRMTTAGARACSHGRLVEIAGLALVRQTPPTAKGTTFLTLEDEEGLLDLILHKETFERHAQLVKTQAFLIARGELQRDRDSISLIVRRLRPIWPDPAAIETAGIVGLSQHLEWHY